MHKHLSPKVCAPVCAPELSCSPAGMQPCGGQGEGDVQNLADPEVTLPCSQASGFTDIGHLRTLHCSWGNIPGQRKELNSHKRARGGNLASQTKTCWSESPHITQASNITWREEGNRLGLCCQENHALLHGEVTGQDGSGGPGHVHRKPRPGLMLRYSGDRRLCGCRTPRQAWRIWPRALLWGHGPTAVEWSVSFQRNGIEPFFFLNHSKSPGEAEEMSGTSFRPVSEVSGS